MGSTGYFRIMNSSESEGLGLSLVVYLAAIFGILAVVALPVYLANKAKTYDNPPLAQSDPLLNGPIIGNRVSARVPLARLKREQIVDPALVRALNEDAEKNEPIHHPVHRTARRSDSTPVADLQAEPKRHTFFLFDLFGG